MHPITLKALDRQKHRFIWMRKSCLSRARALCRCIEQCSKPHCAGARLQGMRLFLENDVIVKYSECAHPPPPPLHPVRWDWQDACSSSTLKDQRKKRIGRNLEDIEGWEGKESVTKIYRHTEKYKPAPSTFGLPFHPHVRGCSRFCSRTVCRPERALSHNRVCSAE